MKKIKEVQEVIPMTPKKLILDTSTSRFTPEAERTLAKYEYLMNQSRTNLSDIDALVNKLEIDAVVDQLRHLFNREIFYK